MEKSAVLFSQKEQKKMGMRFESMADMPEGMRQKYAQQILRRTDCNANARRAGVVAPYTRNDSGKKSKYRALPAAVPLKNGKVLKFDSQKEMRRFLELRQLQEAGVIRNLRLQVDFTLQEGFTTIDGERVRAIRYRADFTYDERDEERERTAAEMGFPCTSWNRVVEDVKGVRTKEYAMKKKMMMDKYHIEIREV